MALNYVTLTVNLYDGQGYPVSRGTATFTPTAQLTDTTDNEIIVQAGIAAFEASGASPAIRLLATDNASVLPAGWAWTVTFTGVPGNPASFSFFLPFANGATQNLSAMTPVSSVTTMQAYMPLTGLVGKAAYYMPAPSGGDDTAAFTAARAALPTTTIWANPNNNSGASAVVPYGTIFLSSGTYKIGAVSDIGNIGPLVNLIGPGRNACTLAYYGTGDCIRAYNPVRPSDDNFDDLAAWYGIIDGFAIDGTNAGAGAAGLHYGDTEAGVLGPDLMIQNFPTGLLAAPSGLSASPVGTGGTFAAGTYYWKITALSRQGETTGSNETSATIVLNGSANLTWTAVPGATGYNIYRGTSSGNETTFITAVGAVTAYTDTGTAGQGSVLPLINTSANTGLWLDNTVSWTENIYGRVSVNNCGNAILVNRNGAAGGDASFEYNDLTFKVYCYPGQNGLVFQNGAQSANASWKLRGNFGESTATQASAVLAVSGQYSGSFTGVQNCHLDIQAETNSIGQGTTHGPYTVYIGGVFTGQNLIQNCSGVINFNAGVWTQSNWSASGSKSNAFVYSGIISGDTHLHPSGGTAGLMVSGPVGYSTTPAFYSGANLTCQMQTGDVFTGTLTQNTTIAVNETMAGPQRKTIILTQASSGGPYTVTWPSNGSPTTSSPTVKWPSGVAPVMSPGASAVDVYLLETPDGATWYGTYSQNVGTSGGTSPASTPGGVTTAGLGLQLLTLPVEAIGAATGGTSQRFEAFLVTAPASAAVSTLGIWYQGAALSVSNPCELAIFSEAGAQLGVTADMSASVTNQANYAALEGAITTVNLVAGTNYYLAMLFTGTTVPNFANSQASQGFGVLNGHYGSVLINSQGSMPASFTPSTATANSRVRMIWAR